MSDQELTQNINSLRKAINGLTIAIVYLVELEKKVHGIELDKPKDLQEIK